MNESLKLAGYSYTTSVFQKLVSNRFVQLLALEQLMLCCRMSSCASRKNPGLPVYMFDIQSPDRLSYLSYPFTVSTPEGQLLDGHFVLLSEPASDREKCSAVAKRYGANFLHARFKGHISLFTGLHFHKPAMQLENLKDESNDVQLSQGVLH